MNKQKIVNILRKKILEKKRKSYTIKILKKKMEDSKSESNSEE